jgi:hypothetical protein
MQVASHHQAASGGRLARARAPGPVGVCVHLDAVGRLALVAEDHARACAQVAAQSFERHHGQSSRARHEAAHFLGGVQNINAVGSKIVRTRCKPSEAGELALAQLLFGLNLVRQNLLTGSGGAVGSFKLNLDKELLNLPGISLVLNPLGRPSDVSIEY